MKDPYFDFGMTAKQAEVLAVTHAAGAALGFGLTQERREIAAELDRRILEFKAKHPVEP